MASMRPERAYSPAARSSDAPDSSRVLVIGCGALARELVAVIDQAGLANVDLTCLPATLHNRPGGIPAAVRTKIRAARPRYERIFIAYADCGTGGLLDLALADEGVERLPGAHCYEFYSGSEAFAAMSDEDPATFYLTDFLARNFDRLVITGLGLDRHPELLSTYFGNYHRLVYLAQTDDPGLVAAARRAARRLGLTFEMRRTGYGDLATGVAAAASVAATPAAAGTPAAGPRPAAIAPDATNVVAPPLIRRSRVDSLLLEQHTLPLGRSDATALRQGQGIASPPSTRRPSVHSTQRPAETLHRLQRSAELDAVTGSPDRVSTAPARPSGTR
jgi:hypothetical protein